MTKSIQSNKVENFDTIKNKTIADTLAAPFSGNLTLKFVKKYVDQIINVTEEEIILSMKEIIERLKIFPEPAASACFAPLLFDKIDIKKRSKCIVVICGGNFDLKTLKKLF